MNQDNEVLVKVEGVSKKFCRDLKKSLWYGVKDVVSELNPFASNSTSNKEQGTKNQEYEASLRDGEFWANKDISFELRRGECLGLVGRNGAGKTTLLKMLNGLIKPDSGRIEMRGRVGALIALGAGFNPILTGRENIYVNGSILGLSKAEIDAKLDEIIEFSEISEFIDAPVQSYSSGMNVRLGFAVAAALEPDVLILDEVLAVGDARFRAKSLERVSKLLKRSAVIFVSHQESQIFRICESVIWLEKGRIVRSGPPKTVMCDYQKMNVVNNRSRSDVQVNEFLSIKFSALNKEIAYGESLRVMVKVVPKKTFYIRSIIIGIENNRNEIIAHARVELDISFEESPIGFQLNLRKLLLSAGQYRININMFEDKNSKYHILHRLNIVSFVIVNSRVTDASYLPELTVSDCSVVR